MSMPTPWSRRRVAAAGQLPDQLGAALLSTARAAFTQGLHLTALISTVVVIATAILAVVVLPRVRPGSDLRGNRTRSLQSDTRHRPHSPTFTFVD